MQRYRFVDHTADTQLQVEGGTREDLFQAALQGMNEIIKPGFCQEFQEGALSEEVQIESPDLTALLIDFLSEVLYLTQTRHALYCKARFEQLEETILRVTLQGQKAEAFEEDIKAVTHHEAHIRKTKPGHYMTPVIFDI